MKKIIAAGLLTGVALLTPAFAHADSGFSGHKGDRDVRAFWEDTGRQFSDPESVVSHTCQMRQQGLSEQDILSLGAPAMKLVYIQAAEWHFCPAYYG